ncbi:hypothetical protein AWRI1631_152250 [Saccharomyces cerevisiae AWRI1631]|uniref:Uncharacterized protein n=1 Tax=Saccharomyces cerevisiae (strain AWRI1631) TaxID=545124 RepID=B5VRW2_YEAS6|nr:hypothetical protein AWRI1631_152250 [Saccharomyces cerevisiae AWRI1631]
MKLTVLPASTEPRRLLPQWVVSSTTVKLRTTLSWLKVVSQVTERELLL